MKDGYPGSNGSMGTVPIADNGRIGLEAMFSELGGVARGRHWFGHWCGVGLRGL